MRILFVDNDIERVRSVHSEVLSYRGVPWDLVHCQRLSDAKSRLESEEFDAVLLSMPKPETDDFQALIVAHPDSPMLVVLEDDCLASQVELVQRGAADCLCWDEVDGNYLMRRLRLAVSRSHRSAAVIQRVRHQWAAPQANFAEASAGRGTAAGGGTAAADQLLTGIRDGAPVDLKDSLSLIVIGDQSDRSPVISSESETPGLSTVRVENLTTAGEAIRNSLVTHAVVVMQAVVADEGFEAMQLLRTDLGAVPLLMLMSDVSDSAAVSCIEQGMEDCYAKATVSWPMLDRAVRLAWARMSYVQKRLDETHENRPEISDRRVAASSRGDRRSSPRYLVTCPVIAIPVLPNLTPEKNGICEAFTFDVSTGGVGIQMASRQVLPSRNWVLGFESVYDDQSRDWHFANVVVRHTSYSPGGIQLNMQFQQAEEDLFRPGNLYPELQHDTHRLLPSLPQQTLDDWIDVGVLKRVVLNRIKTCPECSGAALIGEGCRECGAAQIEYRDLLHHFACAYVGDAEEFRSEAGVACPKCLARGLVVGADFEVINTTYECSRCGFTGTEVEQVGSCIHCQLRFPLRLARDEEVFGYDVDRLDILAFLSATT